MLKAYQQQNGGLKGVTIGEGESIPAAAVWLDLLNPTLEERRSVDRLLSLEMPTRADMEEIEISSRLYQEDQTLFMTAMVLAHQPIPAGRRVASCNGQGAKSAIGSVGSLAPGIRQRYIGRIEGLDGGAAEEAKGSVDAFAKDLEGVGDARFSCGTEAVGVGTAD